MTLATPRDRDGTFEPQLIGKHQRRVLGFNEKILAVYANHFAILFEGRMPKDGK